MDSRNIKEIESMDLIINSLKIFVGFLSLAIE